MPRLVFLAAALSTVVCNYGVLPALSIAARRGDLARVRDLLDEGGDPNEAGAGGTRWPPLLHAVHKHQIDAARLLLDYGADPDGSSPNGYTALMMAASERDTAIVTLLLDYGADARRVGPGGVTALGEAVTGSIGRLARPLAGGCDPDTVGLLLARAPDLTLPGGPAGREAEFWMRLHAGLERMRNVALVPTTGAAPEIDCAVVMQTVNNRR